MVERLQQHGAAAERHNGDDDDDDEPCESNSSLMLRLLFTVRIINISLYLGSPPITSVVLSEGRSRFNPASLSDLLP